MREIEVDVIPHNEQRYDTCGDYYEYDVKYSLSGRGGPKLVFRITEMADWRSEAAVFLHEFVEAMMCQHMGIAIEQIDAFDFAHADVNEPGELPDCPYRWPHKVATELELRFVNALGLCWDRHSEIVDHATSEFRPERSPSPDSGVRGAGAGVPTLPDRGLSHQAGGAGASGRDRPAEGGGPDAGAVGDAAADPDPAA